VAGGGGVDGSSVIVGASSPEQPDVAARKISARSAANLEKR